MVYTLLVEQLERFVLAERQVAVTALAAGARDVKVPSYQETREKFDNWLTSLPERIDPERAELMQVLGVA